MSFSFNRGRIMSYLNLNVSAPRRLAILKKQADKLNARPHNARKARGDNTPYDWRDVRYSGFHNAAASCGRLSRGLNGDRPVWYAHRGRQFPREQYADEIVNLRHTGWFTDDDGYETCRGLVVSLPHGRYLAGYELSDNGERVYFSDIYVDVNDAAYAADSEAENIADVEREYDQRYREAYALDDELQDAGERLRECLALRNNPCFRHLRKEAASLIELIREKRETLKTDYAEFEGHF